MSHVSIPTAATLRAGCASAFLICVTLIGLPLQALSVALRLPTARWIPVLFHRAACLALGIRISQQGKEDMPRDGAVLITANHASWLDIVVLGQGAPLSFIAKSEVAGWPIFGYLAKLQRTIFVNRTRRSETGKTAGEIAKRLSMGDAMVLFPEGTSSDGNHVLPFRSALIGAASVAMAGRAEEPSKPVWIQPVSIAYVGVQGLPMGRQHRHLAAWYGDMELLPHLWALLKEGALDVHISYGKPILFDKATSRKIVAQQAEETVRILTQKALLGVKAS